MSDDTGTDTILPKPVDDFYTIRQVCDMFQVKPETVRYWIADKKIDAQKVGHNWRVSRASIVTFVEEGRR